MRSALGALTEQDSRAHFEQLREQLRAAEDNITSAVAAEQHRLELLADYEAYVESQWPQSTSYTTAPRQLYHQMAGSLSVTL
ncbi:hypothetical protein V8E36_009563 [Tilletia maclaganii]